MLFNNITFEIVHAWEQRKLGEVAEFSKGSGYSKSDLRDIGNPIILYGRLYTKYETIIEEVDTFAEMKDNPVLSCGGEVIVPSSGETAEDISRASVVVESGVILGGDLNIVKPYSIINSVFLAITISNGNQQKELSRRAQGKSVVHLSNSDLQDVILQVPTLPEQTAIGNFFRTLDNIITLHQRKLDGLKELKRGYLQLMFPQAGERVPRVRFAGFTGDWDERPLKDLITPVVREVPKPNEPYARLSVRSHAKGVFHQKVDDPSSVAMDKLYVVKANDLIVNITFAWEHAIAVTNIEDDGLLVSHRFPTFLIDKSDINFIKFSVSFESFRYKLDLISPGGAGRNRVLNKSDFLNLELIVPKTVSEQTAIGNFLRCLEEQITELQTKLDKLKKFKVAYLYKMFI